MANTIPKNLEIITYSCIYGGPPPNAHVIIKGMCKKTLITEIVNINHWLNPKNKVYFDNSFATQVDILAYLTKKDETNLLFNHYLVPILKIIEDKKKALNIFSRANCLFALEQITNAEDIKNILDFKMNTPEMWKNLIDYLLAINWEFVDRENRGLEKIKENSIETLNPVTLMVNELMIESHFTFTSYRGLLMVYHYLNSNTYGQELISYCDKKYQLHPKEFCTRIINLYMKDSIETSQDFALIKTLSERSRFQENYKLLGLRKSPFIEVDVNEFLLADKIFLIEKIYSHLLNEFWFDWLKPKENEINQPLFRMDDYRGVFGRFFENYGTGLLKDMFAKYNDSICLGLDELKPRKKKKEELCDFYLRHENKIILCEIKGGGIDDKSKYGGDIESLYKENRAKFFDRYGVDQLVIALENLNKIAPKIDSNFPIGNTISIYPILIVNEKIFQTAFMAQIFNARFHEKISDLNLPKVNIKPLALTHISDWENAEDFLSESPKEIWELLDYHYRDKNYIPPFFNTLNLKLPLLTGDRKAVNKFLSLLDLNN